MNYEEFKTVIGECLQNPDKLQEYTDSLLDAYKENFETTEAFKSEIETLKNKNNDLRDVNVKLLMRQSFDAPKEEPEETPEQVLERITNKILGE